MLVKNVAGDSIKVRRDALVSDLGALCKLTRYAVDRIVGKLKRRNTPSTLKVFYESASNVLVLSPARFWSESNLARSLLKVS